MTMSVSFNLPICDLRYDFPFVRFILKLFYTSPDKVMLFDYALTFGDVGVMRREVKVVLLRS